MRKSAGEHQLVRDRKKQVKMSLRRQLDYRTSANHQPASPCSRVLSDITDDDKEFQSLMTDKE